MHAEQPTELGKGGSRLITATCLDDIGFGQFQLVRSAGHAAFLQVSRDRAAMDAEGLGQVPERLASVIARDETIDFVGVKTALNEETLGV